jgi:hypothetical protein
MQHPSEELVPQDPTPGRAIRPVVIRVAGINRADVITDWVLLSAISAALFLPFAYLATRAPASADHTVRTLLDPA